MTTKPEIFSSISNITERRRVFLEDTANHYNSENRSINPLILNSKILGFPQCLYFPKSPASEGCAIGRWLDEKLAKKMDNSNNGASISDLWEEFENKLPEWMTEMGQEFLVCVQNLHDSGGNWGKNGLNEFGLAEVVAIKGKFNL